MKVYKFNPDDFKDIQFMTEDLADFYLALEKYSVSESLENKLYLINALEKITLTIKQRVVDGWISPVLAEELNSYIEELLND